MVFNLTSWQLSTFLYAVESTFKNLIVMSSPFPRSFKIFGTEAEQLRASLVFVLCFFSKILNSHGAIVQQGVEMRAGKFSVKPGEM